MVLTRREALACIIALIAAQQVHSKPFVPSSLRGVESNARRHITKIRELLLLGGGEDSDSSLSDLEATPGMFKPLQWSNDGDCFNGFHKNGSPCNVQNRIDGTYSPTSEPTAEPVPVPTAAPVAVPVPVPTTASPTAPAVYDFYHITRAPSSASPTDAPTASPTDAPTASPTDAPTLIPTATPTQDAGLDDASGAINYNGDVEPEPETNKSSDGPRLPLPSEPQPNSFSESEDQVGDLPDSSNNIIGGVALGSKNEGKSKSTSNGTNSLLLFIVTI